MTRQEQAIDDFKRKPHYADPYEYCNNDGTFVRVVSPSGNVCDDDCDGSFGVRPVCILKSNIFVSKVEEVMN